MQLQDVHANLQGAEDNTQRFEGEEERFEEAKKARLELISLFVEDGWVDKNLGHEVRASQPQLAELVPWRYRYNVDIANAADETTESANDFHARRNQFTPLFCRVRTDA